MLLQVQKNLSNMLQLHYEQLIIVKSGSLKISFNGYHPSSYCKQCGNIITRAKIFHTQNR